MLAPSRAIPWGPQGACGHCLHWPRAFGMARSPWSAWKKRLARFLITTLAEYQTYFWVEVGQALEKAGHQVSFLSFDGRSNELLGAAGLSCNDATASAREAALGSQDPEAVCASFGVNEPERWLTHEMFAFGVRDSAALLRKLAGTLCVAEQAIAAAPRPLILVQELGGFLSVTGTHLVARKANVPSWFIEPSFFRGRMLFIEGGIEAFQLPNAAEAPVTKELQDYLAQTLDHSLIVIPQKDRHQYTSAFRKVVNWRNLRRLGEKIVDKHVLGKQQEFGHIGSHVSTHARMILASRRLAPHYTSLDEVGRFIYFPLHVPGDVALTMRSPEYLDQIALIDYICRVAPLGYRVAVKEHPAMIGAIGSAPLLGLKARYDRFVILPPTTNNYAVQRAAEAIVTVNSKSGAEAGLLGQKVIVLGDAFYRSAPFARPIDRLAELGSALRAVLGGEDRPPPSDAVRGYFAALWQQTHPGELYVDAPANIAAFTESMVISTTGGIHSAGGRT